MDCYKERLLWDFVHAVIELMMEASAVTVEAP